MTQSPVLPFIKPVSRLPKNATFRRNLCNSSTNPTSKIILRTLAKVPKGTSERRLPYIPEKQLRLKIEEGYL
jgi:hypothetical protein